MRTNESGSITKGFSCDASIDELIETNCRSYKITKSSFIRLGIQLAAHKLENKEIEKARKLIGTK